jgi:hypothetical protein
MFLLHCDHCGRRELRGPRSLHTDPTGAFVAECRACGRTSAIAGRRAVEPSVTPAPSPTSTPGQAPAPAAA